MLRERKKTLDIFSGRCLVLQLLLLKESSKEQVINLGTQPRQRAVYKYRGTEAYAIHILIR
jgi:hypothetical protein